MYPIVRLAKEFFVHRNAPELPVSGVHISHHRCWPQDIDMFVEMNNGRILTILDLGRTVLAKRVYLLRTLKENKWGLTMAGASVRYRRRIRPFEKFIVKSRCIGWDERFFYLDQTIWVYDKCAAQALYRSAVTDKNGIVAPDRVFTAAGSTDARPILPDWAQNWIDAEDTRIWPPEVGPEPA